MASGRRCRVVGAVSMDQTVIDVGDLAVRAGDVAVMFGTGGRDGTGEPGGEAWSEGGGEGGSGGGGTAGGVEPTTADWARWCGIPEQAVMTGVGPRVRRVHLLATDAERSRTLHHGEVGIHA